MIEGRPPIEVQRWVLARLWSARILADILAQKSGAPPPLSLPKTLEALLIDDWHANLRRWWPQLRRRIAPKN